MEFDDFVPISSLNHFAYCPHRCWRIFCACEFEDNLFTIEGTSLHERVDSIGCDMRENVQQVRAIWLRSERYQLIGRADLVELVSGEVYPVEYKRGKLGEWDNDWLQVCAQALCLEEMIGQVVEKGYIYYAQTHRRLLVEITPDLREETVRVIAQVQSLFRGEYVPESVYLPRCKGCSLFNQCLPRAKEKVARYREVI